MLWKRTQFSYILYVYQPDQALQKTISGSIIYNDKETRIEPKNEKNGREKNKF